ncbi:MAG: hypothetical protein Q4E35_04130 [Eubacteriales bacterium]|nr:hypothetical protein [Eubacteriales bacterium]
MTTVSETIKAATEELAMHESDEGVNTALQTAIRNAVEKAVETGENTAYVSLDNTTYVGGLINISESGSVNRYVFEGADGAATIDCDVEIRSVLVEMINVLFGSDCTVLVDSSGRLTVGEEDGERFGGTLNVIAGDPKRENSSGKVTVYAGNGAVVNSDIVKGSVTVLNSDGDKIVFSGNTSVGISSDEDRETLKECTVTLTSGEEVTVEYINAWDTDVVIVSPVVTLEKDEDEDGNTLRSLKIVAASEDSEVFNLTDSMGLSDILAKIGVTDVLSVAAPVEKAQVSINGSLKALNDITVYSFTTQTKNLLNTQFVNTAMNVKIGSATIKLADGVSLEAGRDITLKATTRSEAGYDEAGKAQTGVLPLAFNVFVENAAVDLGRDTLLTAGRDITADALSTIKANASCSFGSLFIGAAFNVIVNDASVKAVGTGLKAGRDVNLISKADTTAVADAERSAKNTSLDGLYFATNVVIQSSETNVGNATSITAERDVNISSSSDVDATDDAIASVGSMSENVSAFPLKSALKTVGFELLGNLTDAIFSSDAIKGKLDSLGEFFTTASGKLKKAQKFFETDGYSVEIDPSAQEKGTVRTSTVGEGNDRLVITVNSKYRVDQVLVRYLPYQEDASGSTPSYKFISVGLNKETGKYETDLMKTVKEAKDLVTLDQFRVYVIYSDELKSEVELEEIPSDDDDGFTLADLFDTAMESAADDADADADCAGSVQIEYVYKVNGAEDKTKGFTVPDAMAAGVGLNTTSLSVITGVAEGKNVRLNVSPAIYNGVKYKVASMSASYIDSTGAEKTVTIEKNNAGHYILTVPTDIQNNTLTLTTEFEPGEESKTTPSANQITGSLAVGVVVNSNDAVVDLGSGSITAGGNVNVSAEATSNIAGKADGTAVTEASSTSGKNVRQAAAGTDLTMETVKVKKDGKETDDKLYVYGRSLENGVSAVVNGTVYTVTLSPNGDYGYSLPETVKLVVLGEDNREHTVEVSGTNGVYTVDIAKIDFKTDSLTDKVQDTPFAVRSAKLVAVYDAKTYKVNTDAGKNGSVTVDRSSVCGYDTITVTAAPKTGYAVEKVLLRYIDEFGLTQNVEFNAVKDFYVYALPKDSELAKWGTSALNGSTMSVVVTFVEEAAKQTVKVDDSIGSYVSVDKETASYGETITIRDKNGMNLKLDPRKLKVTYTDSAGKEIEVKLNDDLTFTIPVKGAISGETTFTVKRVQSDDSYKTELKVGLTADAAENGSVSVNNGRTMTGAGDFFYVTVKGNEGYVLKAGTLTAEFVKDGKTVKLGAPVSVGGGVYKFTVGDAVGNNGGQITVKAEFTDEEASTSSTGVAVAVNAEVHRNNAVIKSGSISAAGGISVSALTNGKAVTEAKAGYSTAKTGVAGAIAVAVNSYKTNAAVNSGVSLNENRGEAHKLSVDARSNISSFKTDADATNMKIVPDPNGDGVLVPGYGFVEPDGSVVSEDAIILPGIGIVKPAKGNTAGKTGVGTGIAVAVNGVETNAAISDGVIYNYTYTKALDRVSVSSGNTLASDEVNAKAGAASGKTAVSPVVALNIVSSDAKAYLGRFEQTLDGGNGNIVAPLNAKAVEVKASNSAAHKMTVATYAIGDSTAVAGSFGINIISDAAEALLNSDIRGSASDVTVDSQSVSTLEAYVAAGAAGAREGTKKADDSKGSADQKADGIISSGEKLGAKAGMGSPTENTVSGRQQAQTSEGAVAGAAAFALNIQSNKSEAKIADGVTLGGRTPASALADISVGSRAQTAADISSDSSATSVQKKLVPSGGKSVGVGVSVAINIVSSENKAYLGSGILNAGDVSVTALGVKDDKGADMTNKFSTSSASGASAGNVGVAGSVALAVLNNTTSALINKAENDMYTAASTTVRAEDTRTAETTASASATQSGKADKNATKTDSEKTAAADKGKSVGVGASFAMVYGDNEVFAKFIAPAVSDAGDVRIEARSDHSEESTAVAGSDAYKNLFPEGYDFTGKSTNIAIDAAVAVNAIETSVEALLTADSFAPVINAKTVRLSAVEKGHSKTDSSGYALGDETAVGGSVAVNLNRSSVRAGNDGVLKVSGGDYADDDGEVHRSAEITAASEVTEENLSFAMAAGGDVLRYVEKYKSLLNTLDRYKSIISLEVGKAQAYVNLIKGFLDGSFFEELKAKFDEAVKTCKELGEKLLSVGLTSDEQKQLDAAKETVEKGQANSGNSLADKLLSLIPIAEDVKNAGSKLNSLSTNLLWMRNIASPSTSKMDSTTGKAIGETNNEMGDTGTQVGNSGNVSKDSESMQIAAAVAVSVSDHRVIAENKGKIEAVNGSVKIAADNSTDAMAHAAGAAVSTSGGFGSIGIAIAVKVDQNVVRAVSENSITVGRGKDVIISANLSENTHDFSGNTTGTKTDFTTTIGTQAVAGAVSGDAKAAVSGAVAVFVSASETLAELADNAVIQAVENGRAGNVSITAVETARQTLRTVAVSASQANLSLGISAGVLVTKNDTTARVGSSSSVKARNISVEAQRKAVSSDTDTGISAKSTEGDPDFGSTEDGEEGDGDDSGTTGVTVSGLGDEPILVIDTSKATTAQAGETISVNIGQTQITALLESVMNKLSRVDYYIEVGSGSVAADSGKAGSSGVGSIAGSVAVVTLSNTVRAIVDEGAVLDAGEDENSGNISVKAHSDEQTRVISGAVSADTAASAKLAVGAVIAFLNENNTVSAYVNDGAVITAAGAFSLAARNTGRSEVYTVTGTVAETGTPATAGVAATINVILSETDVSVRLGDPGSGKAHTAQTAEIIAENSKALRDITVSLDVSNAKVQVGGAVAVIVEESSASVDAEDTTLYVTGKFASADKASGRKLVEDSVVIRADNTHDMFVIVSSASVSAGAGAGQSAANIAGVVSVILDTSAASVSTSGSVITSNYTSGYKDIENAGNIVIAARNESDLLNVNVQVTAGPGKGAAVGAAVTVNILRRTVENTVSTADRPTEIRAGNGDISLTADAADTVVIVAAGANATTAKGSIQGTFVVLVENNTTALTAKNITLETVNLSPSFSIGDITIRSAFTGELYGVAGGVNFTTGSVAAGATVIVAVTDNSTTVDLSSGSVLDASGVTDITSAADTKTLFISIGAAAASGTAAVEGSVVTVVAEDTIGIDLGNASVRGGKVSINARGSSSETYISGALAASESVSVGPSAVVFVKERTVAVDSAPGGKIGGEKGCNVTVLAETDDDIFTLVLAMAASGTASVSAGICTEIISNTVRCDIDADINAGGFEVDIGAKSDRSIANYIFGGGFAGNAAVVPVATVIYLTDTVTADVSGTLTGRILNVTADTAFALKEVAAGVAVAGTAGVSGTVAVVVNEADTRAVFSGAHTGEGTQRELNVLANDYYKFDSLMANLAAGGAAGVGVNAAITVVKNNVLASVGDRNAKKDITADTVKVSAQSIRDVSSLVGALSFAGTAAASVNVAVVVAGANLPQDAYDSLTRSFYAENDKGEYETVKKEDGKDYSCFDSEELLASIGAGNAYAEKRGYLETVTLDEDIQGNGRNDSDIEVGRIEGGKLVEELADTETVDYTADGKNAVESKKLRGEDSDIDPTEASAANAKAAQSVGYTYSEDITAAVQALVFNVNIDCMDISLTANDVQTADIDVINGALGVEVGASVGVAVLVLHSNVAAALEETADVICRSLEINAASGTPDDGKIAVVGGSAGVGGIAGVAVAAGVVHLDDTVMASLAGNVTARSQNTGIGNAVNVIAASNYKDVSASTAAVGGGLVGVGASVAVVSFNGAVRSSVSGNILSARSRSGAVTSGFTSVNSLVFLNNSVTAEAASLGAGAVGAAIGAAVVSETLTAVAGIEKGAVVELDNTRDNTGSDLRVLVAGSFDGENVTKGAVKGTAQIASVSGGAVAAGFAAAIAYIAPTITSYIDGTVTGTRSGLDVTVGSDILTESDTGLVFAGGGAVSFGANVLLSYNTTKAQSGVTGSVTADVLTVMSRLSANAVSSMDGIKAGGAALGVSTALSVLKASNEAAVGENADIRVKTLNILAGATAPGADQKGADFFSEAELFSGSVALGSLELNVAVALNKAVNKAALTSNGKVIADTVNVYAYGNPTAVSATKKLSGALAAAGGSAAASTLSFTQLAEIDCTDLNGLNGGLTAVKAGSYMYPGSGMNSGKVTGDHDQASSGVDIFEISGLAINANVSYAKNSTESRVSASFNAPIGSVTLTNNGSANARAAVTETGRSALGIGANVVLGYVQAKFITELNTNGVEGDVSLETDFNSNASTSVKAASSSLAALQANVIVAKSTTEGTTVFDGGGRDVKAGVINVMTTGKSTTDAEVLKADPVIGSVDISTLAIAANVIESVLAAKQSAQLNNIRVVGSPDINVSSALNASGDRRTYSALAKYEGAPDSVGVDISFAEIGVNVVLAKNYAENLASVSGVTASSGSRLGNVSVLANSNANAFANAGTYDEDGNRAKDQNGFEVALIGIGVIVTDAENRSSNIAQVNNLSADAATLSVTANQDESFAISSGGTSSNGVIKAAAVNVNVSDALNSAVNKAVITGCQGTIGTIALKTAAEKVYATAHIGSADLTVAAVSIAANVVNAVNSYTGSALVDQSRLICNLLDVSSVENRNHSLDAYKAVTSADVGAAGTTDSKITVSFLTGDVNKASAENSSEVTAKVSNTVLGDRTHANGNVSIYAYGTSDVTANIAGSSKIGLLSTTVISTEAKANGTVTAEFDPTETQSRIASLNVNALGEAQAEAVTGVAGGIDASLVSVEANSADADIGMYVNAAVSGGNLRVSGKADVNALASARAYAEAQSPSFAISLASIGINKAKATGNIRVSADIMPGSYSFGTLNVKAGIPAEGEAKYGFNDTFKASYTTALVRPSFATDDPEASKSKSITLIGGSNHTSDAISEHDVSVNIGKGGQGTITAGTVTVNAVGNAATEARSMDVDAKYGLVSGGGSVSTATEKDVTEVNIDIAELTTTGTLNVRASNDSANVTSRGTTPGGVTVVNVIDTKIGANIDNTARISVNGAISSGDIVLSAENTGNASTGLSSNGGTVGLLEVDSASVPVVENFLTEIVFGSGSRVQSGSGIALNTETNSEGESLVSQSIAAVGFNASMLYGSIDVTSINHIKVDRNAALTAGNGDLAVNMINSGKHLSSSDFNSGFSLVGVDKVRAELGCNVSNIFEMETGSSLRADNGSVRIEQNSSDLNLSAYSETRSRDVVGVPTAVGTNTLNSDNLLRFADIRAGKSIVVSQYGGAEKAQSYGRIYEYTVATDCEASGRNIFTINNKVAALDDGDMNAKTVHIAQGADKLGMNAAAHAWADSLLAVLSGEALNSASINNELSGGTKEIGAGADRVFVSDIDASGNIECESSAAGGIEIGSIDSENTLTVTSSGFGEGSYSGFKGYQNKFAVTGITGADDTTVTYVPDNLPVYQPTDEPDDPVDPVDPVGAAETVDSADSDKKSNVYVEMFLKQVEESKNPDRSIVDGLKFYVDFEGFLVFENSALFAADLDQMDINWIYAFLTAENVRFMADQRLISELDPDTELSELIGSAFAAGNVTVSGNSIRFSVVENGQRHDYEIVFDETSRKASAYCLDGGKKRPVSIVVIEQDGVMNVIVYFEEENIKEAFILIPELTDGELPVIKVKVSRSMLGMLPFN